MVWFVRARSTRARAPNEQVAELAGGIATNDSVCTLVIKRCLLSEGGYACLGTALKTNRWLTEIVTDDDDSTQRLSAAIKAHAALNRRVHDCVRRGQKGEVSAEELRRLLLECGARQKSTLVPALLALGADAGVVAADGRTLHAILLDDPITVGCPVRPGAGLRASAATAARACVPRVPHLRVPPGPPAANRACHAYVRRLNLRLLRHPGPLDLGVR